MSFKMNNFMEKNKVTNGISKFPQPGVDEAVNCSMHLVKVQGER